MLQSATVLNSIHLFGPYALGFTGVESFPPQDYDPAASLTFSDWTFNLRYKGGVVKDYKPYFQKIVEDDNATIQVRGEDETHNIKLVIWNADGTVNTNLDMPYLADSTDKYQVILNVANLPAGRNVKYRIGVWDEDDESLVFVSDLFWVYPILLTSKLQKTLLLSCSNAGSIDYADAYSETVFPFRVDASHQREVPTETIESDRYASGLPVQLTGEVRWKRLLKILPAPAYIHHKIQAMMKARTFSIQGIHLVQEEPYEINWAHEDNEYGTGRVLLSKGNYNDSVLRNVFKL